MGSDNVIQPAAPGGNGGGGKGAIVQSARSKEEADPPAFDDRFMFVGSGQAGDGTEAIGQWPATQNGTFKRVRVNVYLNSSITGGFADLRINAAVVATIPIPAGPFTGILTVATEPAVLAGDLVSGQIRQNAAGADQEIQANMSFDYE